MELRPLLITRVCNVLPGCLLIGFGIERWFEATAGLLAAMLAVAGLVLAIRGYRLGARYDGEVLTVRGLFRSRRIHRSTIREITVFPAVRWSGRSGSSNWTPIIAFAEFGGVVKSVETRNEQAIQALERWCRR